jgi:mannosyltransferase OCH1-like enzyme
MRTNWPTFNESMKYCRNYATKKTSFDRWNFVEQKYYEIKNRAPQKQKIPKILHQIWIGGDIPEREKAFCIQAKNALPSDWTYKLWRDEDVLSLANFTQAEPYNKTPSLGQKSDLLRLFILCEFGGVYCDTDFVLNKPFDDLLDLDFFGGVVYDEVPNIANSVMGSSPKNELILDMQILDEPMRHNDGMDIINTTGQGLITNKIFKNKDTFTNFVVLPNLFLYPFPNCPTCRDAGSDYRSYITDETYCCHLWHGSWM